MNLDIQQHIPEDFNDDSKVWIYQSSRLFFISEALEMEEMLKILWPTGKAMVPVKGFANLFLASLLY